MSNAPQRGFYPLLMGLHLVTAGGVVATCARATVARFRDTRTFSTYALAVLGLEFVLMFSWALYYGTHSEPVRRALRILLWTHVALSPVLVWTLR